MTDAIRTADPPYGDGPQRGLSVSGRAPVALGLAVVATVAIAWVFNWWALDARNFFFADDWGWLGRAEFRPWEWVGRLWPDRMYNSRPIGEALIVGLYAVFGLEPVAHHHVLLLLHALNGALLVLVLWPHVMPVRAVIGAALAVTWHVALGPVGWLGAIFDLLATTWCLAAVLLYRRALDGRGPALPWALAAAFAYLLAVRTKEFAIGLVLVLLAYEFLFGLGDKRIRLRRLAPSLVVAAVIGARYAWLIATRVPEPGDPYNPGFSVAAMASAALEYLQYLTYTTSAPAYVALAGLIAFVAIVGASRSRLAVWGLAAALILLLPVLILPAQRTPLYLYAPHFFLAAALVAPWPRSRAVTVLAAAVCVALVAWPLIGGLVRNDRTFALANGSYSRGLWEQFRRLPPATAEYLRVDRAYFSPFGYGARSPETAAVRPSRQVTAVHILRGDSSFPVVVSEAMPPLVEAFCTHADAGSRLLDEQAGRLQDRTAWARAQCAPGGWVVQPSSPTR